MDAACTLFNRTTNISVNAEKTTEFDDTDIALLAATYYEYREALTEKHRTDQALLQQQFLDYLATLPL